MSQDDPNRHEAQMRYQDRIGLERLAQKVLLDAGKVEEAEGCEEIIKLLRRAQDAERDNPPPADPRPPNPLAIMLMVVTRELAGEMEVATFLSGLGLGIHFVEAHPEEARRFVLAMEAQTGGEAQTARARWIANWFAEEMRRVGL